MSATQTIASVKGGMSYGWNCTCGNSSQFPLIGINAAHKSAQLHAEQHAMAENNDEDES